MIYFLDSSGLVKRYVNEAGSEWMRQNIFSGNHTLFIAQITAIEVMSAIYRKHREGVYNDRTVEAMRIWLERHLRQNYQQAPLNPIIIKQAQALLKQYPLRAYDSVQLATALYINNGVRQIPNERFVFVTSDAKLYEFAVNEGLIAINPQKL